MCVRMCPLTMEEAQAVLDARATPGAHAIRYIERPDPLRDGPAGKPRSRLRPRGRRPRRSSPHVGLPARRQAQRRLQHAHRVRPRAASPGQARHVDQGHSGGALPRARARLLRVARHGDGRQRENRQAGQTPVPLPAPRRKGVPARRRPGRRPLLRRHHRTQRQRRPGPRPHAARSRTGRVEHLARSGLRKPC